MRMTATSRIATLALLGVLAAGPALAADSFFDVFTELPVVGQAPTSPVITIIGSYFAGSFQPDAECSQRVLSLNGLPPGTPVWLTGGGGGSGGSPPGLSSFFDVFLDLDVPSPTSNRRISDVRIVHPPGTPPGTWRLVPLHPLEPVGSPASFFDVFVTPGFFDITYRVAGPTGEHTLHMHCDSPSGRCSFQNVQCHALDPDLDGDGVYEAFFDIFVDCDMVGPKNPALPDQHCTTTGNFSGGPTATEHSTWGAIKRLYR